MTSRRSVLKAAAYSLPAIAVAVATPAIAASDTCPDETYFHDDGTVQFTVRTGHYVQAVFLKDYPHATALNIDGQILLKYDNGVKAGDSFFAELPSGLCDPSFIQVDGTNTHYYGNGVFIQ